MARSHRVLMLVVVAVVALGVAGCRYAHSGYESFFEPDSADQHYTPNDWTVVQSHYRAYLNGVAGVEWHLSYHDPHGLDTGSGHRTKFVGRGRAASLLRRLSRVTSPARLTAAYYGTTRYSASGIARVNGGRAGTLCLAYSGKTVSGYGDQLWQGTFRIVGGRGAIARLHGSGRFLALQPDHLTSFAHPFPLWLHVGFRRLTIGARQPYSSACRNATRPFPAPPKQNGPSVKVDGFAFASIAVEKARGPLPPGTKVYPAGTVISGQPDCTGTDDNLYLVVSYTGPQGATLAQQTAPAFTYPLKSGQNAVFLESSPANGAVSIQATASAPGYSSVRVKSSVTLARTCPTP